MSELMAKFMLGPILTPEEMQKAVVEVRVCTCGHDGFRMKVQPNKDGALRPDYRLTCYMCGKDHGLIGWVNYA